MTTNPTQATPPQHTTIPQTLIIWQWNCRGLRRKKEHLLQHMILTATEPDIIVLQETRGIFPIRGYNHFVEPSIRQKQRGTIIPNIPTETATYGRKSIPTIQIEKAHILTRCYAVRHLSAHARYCQLLLDSKSAGLHRGTTQICTSQAKQGAFYTSVGGL